jgi:hypothetical protein
VPRWRPDERGTGSGACSFAASFSCRATHSSLDAAHHNLGHSSARSSNLRLHVSSFVDTQAPRHEAPHEHVL